MGDRPNILFVMTDQHRGDALGADPESPTDADGYPLVHTPNLDSFVEEGAFFTRAYTPVPSCIPARRCMLTGQTPFTNGCVGWKETPWDFEYTLPGELSDAGYQTKLAGKIHSIPQESNVGFEHMDQHEALYSHPEEDYAQWLREQGNSQFDENSHGLGKNTWDPRPWHLPEQYHPTVWTTNRAVDFLENRDPTRPFFLNLSYVRPHTPFDPPQVYWDMYADRDLPEPYMGDWAEDAYGHRVPEFPAADAWVADLSPTIEHRTRAGYYGLVTQIDHQIKRVIDALRVQGEFENTFIVMCSDHGEMLGDHYLWRKTYAFEGSARVPFVMRFPDAWEYDRKQFIDRPIGLEDLLPTFLSVADVDIPDAVEGRNLLDLVEDPDREDWRPFYHGENSPGSYDPENAMQYVVDERHKFIWNPVTGEEFLFDLVEDPGEQRNLADDPEHADLHETWRERLIAYLDEQGRPEGYVDGGDLSTVPPGGADIGDIDDCA